MARVTMYWYGGINYAPPDLHNPEDAEVFESLRAAVESFSRRPGHIYYPLVDDIPPEENGPEAFIFFGDEHPVVGQEYPDRRLVFGPRGGVQVHRC